MNSSLLLFACDKFPEYLMFQEIANNQLFQGRYVLLILLMANLNAMLEHSIKGLYLADLNKNRKL